MNPNSDLTVSIENVILNIRSVIILETKEGFVFEKSRDGYLFALGGRVKVNETSYEAAVREVEEEVGSKVLDMKLSGIIENFFKMDAKSDCHEINFVFKAKYSGILDLGKCSLLSAHNGYEYVKLENLDKFDIRPKLIVKLIKSNTPFLHLVNKNL